MGLGGGLEPRTFTLQRKRPKPLGHAAYNNIPLLNPFVSFYCVVAACIDDTPTSFPRSLLARPRGQ